jgi:hypothetical protein
MKFFIKKSVMTEENEKNIEKAFSDLKNWMLPMLKQWKQTRDLSDSQSKLLFEIVAGIKTPVKNVAPVPPLIPKPVLHPMEMGAGAIFAKLDSKRDVMLVEQRIVYDRFRRSFEEDGHTGFSLSWDHVNFLRRLYATLFYRR